MLSTACRKLATAKRHAWKTALAIQMQEEGKGSPFIEVAVGYRERIEADLEAFSRDVISIMDACLLGIQSQAESKVFLIKMKGDQNRYMAECLSGEKSRKAAEEAFRMYKAATEKAMSLPPTNPTRLSLALNYSTFFYEVLNFPTQACALAKAAFDEAVSDPSVLDFEQSKDTNSLMQSLRDNLSLWSAEAQSEDEFNVLERDSK